ncbi:HsmA family protein [Geomesophilobacter sediminis]|uniref:TIGR03987 family protein n=1 Tax=Geomesophilobacter sediminis TaxID=2798584 RepID=A0A8J7SAG8_9BACT|nr:HsmA family protein [Geomesophilobacter sediminis]MBJ6727326.1 TIGR03987 family protein [Geomesophilobacter sediminis]
MLVQAIIWMNLALVFYTWAVFSARKRGLQRRHLAIFGTGLFCDYLGTHLMNGFGNSYGPVPIWHTISGIASISGMAFHFFLAAAASFTSRNGGINRVFDKVSLSIYSCWLVAFCSGAIWQSIEHYPMLKGH